MQTQSNQEFSIIPGIDDYSPGYYAVTVVMWIVLLAVLAGVAVAIFKFVKANFSKTAAGAFNASVNLAEKIAHEVRQSPEQQAKSQREEDAYEIAAKEIEQGVAQKGLWAKAFADAEGNEQKQKALYLRYRAEQLRSEGR